MFESEASNAFKFESGDLEPSLFIPIREAARLLGGITEREIYFRMAAGDLLGVKQGRRRMIERKSLTAYAARLIEEARAAQGDGQAA